MSAPDPTREMTDLRSAVAGEVRAWLGRRSRTQSDLARHLNLNRSAISRRLNGSQDFTVTELGAVAAWLEVSLGELLGGEVLQARRSPHTELVGAGASGELLRLDSNQQPFD